MALQKTVVTPQGFEAADAYHRVENIVLQGKKNIAFSVCSYKNANISQTFAINSAFCAYDLNGDNPLAQAYKHLKTLPEFEGAQDC